MYIIIILDQLHIDKLEYPFYDSYFLFLRMKLVLDFVYSTQSYHYSILHVFKIIFHLINENLSLYFYV